jgi:transcriptional antiterminator NusG
MTEAVDEVVEEQELSEEVDEVTVVDERPASPYDLPGGWYVIHSYSGYEKKVQANLENRVRSMHLEDKIFDVEIPMEDVVEYKNGKKVTVARKKFPGYVLVRMYMDDDSWYAVRNTPNVTGFVGSGTKPSPLSRREVERILGVEKEEGAKKEKPTFKPEWEVGETVRVVEGPFADFNGVIEDINVDQSKVRVLVDIFGRETPVELNFDQIIKY